jgi:predicted nucleotidyltransferase
VPCVIFSFPYRSGIILLNRGLQDSLECIQVNERPVAVADLEEKRKQYRQALGQALEHIVARLSSMPEVEKVILFGSYAAGRRDLFTDLDVLVVMHSDKDFVTRTAELYPQLGAGVDMDLLVYTPEEFERMRQRGFVKHALEGGEVLYEK